MTMNYICPDGKTDGGILYPNPLSGVCFKFYRPGHPVGLSCPCAPVLAGLGINMGEGYDIE